MLIRNLTLVLVTLLLLGSFGCSTGQNVGNNPQTARLQLQTLNIGGAARQVEVAGPLTASFPALTYFVFGSHVALGNRSIVPMEVNRLAEQAFGPFGPGDPSLELDLSPWAGYEYIYVRALLVSPNVIWQIEPGTRYEFTGN